MSNTKKLIQAAAGAAGGAGLDVNEVFSTYLYEGNGTSQTITNDIDLSGEGGLVWVRPRITSDHWLWDSARGTQYSLATNNTAVQTDMSTNGTVFNTDGFTDRMGWGSGTDVASWTFRKAPKFFDVVTYTGTGSPQSIAHNLGSVPGCIIVKTYDNAQGWAVYHRGNTSAPETERLILEQTYATSDDNTYWNDTAPTDTHFTVGSTIRTNSNGYNYVAYLFAHNDGDGDFGDGTQDIIKCGSVTLDGSGQGAVDLGWEPQWVMYKRTDGAGNWIITDSMRGWTALPNQAGASLLANNSVAEGAYSPASYLNSSGFLISGSASQTYIYIAIRRGPMGIPTSATDVFDVELANATTTNGVEFQTGWPVDFAWFKDRDTGTEPFTLLSRLQGNTRYMFSSSAGAETTGVSYGTFDHSDGWYSSTLPSDYYSCMWRRAPSFFDVVAYTGNSNGSTPTQTLTHNLGVKPEMMWVKSRGSSQNWYVFHKDVWDATNNYYLRLNIVGGAGAGDGSIFPSDVTDTQFTVSEKWAVNQSGVAYIAYLFASVDGVSKLGTFTLSGSSYVDVDCGFSSGARFVLVKRHDGIGNWELYDTERGITSGNDPMLALNDTAAESSGPNINPLSSGFSINAANFNAGDYIFYAIA